MFVPIDSNDFHHRYPRLFATREHLACGAGWAPLLHDLCAELERLIEKRLAEAVPDLAGHDGIPMNEPYWPHVVQVKEKFGGLRVYLRWGDESMAEAIERASERSEHTCDVCGAPGTRRMGGWVVTRCDAHAPERA